MQFAQRIPFRIKGKPGLVKLVFGEWAEISEEMLNFDVYVCSSCWTEKSIILSVYA